MTVCFVSHSSSDGGAERVLLETIESLHDEGIECRVLLPSSGHFSRELMRLGIPFSVISFPLWMSRNNLSFALRLKTALNLSKDTAQVAWRISKWKCDVVYSNTVTVCIGAFAAKLLRLPHVWHLHEFGFEDQGLSFLFGKRWSLKVINRMSSACVCVSNALATAYGESIDASKISVIYPSLRCLPSEYSGNGPAAPIVSRTERFRCVIVGALIEGKGQEDAVLAVSVLKKAGVDAELIVIGEGEPGYRRHLQTLAEKNQVAGSVVFTGSVPNAFPSMCSADVVLVCSRSEAFGRVTIEAMYSGKPLIGARSGATAELIDGGVNGLLYKTGDPEDLAAQIKYLYENPGIAKALGTSAKKWVEQRFFENRSTEK
ncbi:MAG: glycosyltransferase family 4 protein, partial [Bryobacteraceae bacterium]